MTSTNDEVQLAGTQGWREFAAEQRRLIDLYHKAKEQSRNKPVQVDHGVIAEGLFREWLAEFLPKRFAVTSGYVISQGAKDTEQLRHFDIIIYDQLAAPVLWTETHPDRSHTGKVRAIPAEYVYCVLEVKARWTAEAAKAAVEKLTELLPLLSIDALGEVYPKFLPREFCCGIVFFELSGKDSNSKNALQNLLAGANLRGFFGALILEAKNRDAPHAGIVDVFSSNEPLSLNEDPNLLGFVFSDTKQDSTGRYIGVMVQWPWAGFARFAFSLIARLNGRYRPGFVSSFHALIYGSSKDEKPEE